MAKNDDKRYAALEITSRAVRLVYGYCQDGKVYVLHALETGVNALDGGLVSDQEALTSAIKGVIHAANETLNIQIREVLVALPPMGLVFCRESSSTTTIGVDNVIVQIDVNNAISQLKNTNSARDFPSSTSSLINTCSTTRSFLRPRRSGRRRKR